MAREADPVQLPRKVSGLKRFRYKLEALALGVFARFIKSLPFEGMVRLADTIGWFTYHLLRYDRRVAMANLDIAFGDAMPVHEKKRLARSAFRNLARALASLFWAPNLTRQNFSQFVTIEPESLDRMRAITSAGRGILFCTPHLGNWELGSIVVGFHDLQLLVVGEPTQNEAIGRTIFNLRSVSGHKVVPPAFVVLKLFRQVAKGGATAMLVDVNGRRGRGGVWNDYFGLPVFNPTAVADLAMRTNAAIMMGVGWPDKTGRVTLKFYDEISAVSTGDRATDVQRITDAITRDVERFVREHPDQWLWTYKRWKRRPTEDRGRYPFYSKFQKVD